MKTRGGKGRLGFAIFFVVIGIATGEQNGAAARIDPGLNILLGVADHPGGGKIDVVTLLGFQQHPNLGLPALADDL